MFWQGGCVYVYISMHVLMYVSKRNNSVFVGFFEVKAVYWRKVE